MARISAEQFSLEGDKYIGRKYEDMDCQKFYEQCAEDAGLRMDLKGSNAWYREFLKNGWVGSPEECKKKFGSVPKGATLFIHAYDHGEEKRGYYDGLGNASHIGIKTGRSGADMTRATGNTNMDYGDGAIHSSSTRKHVATSKFSDKTISGGWNTVGLHPGLFSYGDKIDALLGNITGGWSGNDDGNDSQQEDGKMYTAILKGGNIGKPINIREKPDGALKDTLPQGSEVTVTAEKGDWCKIQYANGKKTGYVKGEFVNVADDDDEPIADDSDIPPEEDWDDSGSERVSITITLTTAQAAYALPVLEKLVKAIVDKVGRG